MKRTHKYILFILNDHAMCKILNSKGTGQLRENVLFCDYHVTYFYQTHVTRE